MPANPSSAEKNQQRVCVFPRLKVKDTSPEPRIGGDRNAAEGIGLGVDCNWGAPSLQDVSSLPSHSFSRGGYGLPGTIHRPELN